MIAWKGKLRDRFTLSLIEAGCELADGLLMQNGPPHIRVVAALSELWARELPWRPPRLLLLDALSFEGSRARALCKRGVKHRLKRHGEALAIVGRAPRKRDDCDRQNRVIACALVSRRHVCDFGGGFGELAVRDVLRR